jgi:predicted enzyme related to lactoylglutathione lyase
MDATISPKEQSMTQAGDFTHIEIPADDVDRAQRFYNGVFGWQLQAVEGYPDYFLFTTPSGEEFPGGAVGKRGQSAPEQVRNYVLVTSIDETVPQVEALGGLIVEPKAEVPGQGWYAVFKDSEGNELALWESAPRD